MNLKPLGNPIILILNFQLNKKLIKIKLGTGSVIKQQQIVMVTFYTFLHHEKSNWLLSVHEKNSSRVAVIRIFQRKSTEG